MDHRGYFQAAIKEAHRAYAKKEVPIGAVVVNASGEIIGRGWNQTNGTRNATKHAEIQALTQAARKVGDWRLTQAKLYVTVEPCLMCLGAALLSRIKEIHFVISDPTFGSIRSVLGKQGVKGAYKGVRFVWHPELAEEVEPLMKEFFRELRRKK